MDDTRTARATGLWYLTVGITGMAGFLVVRPRLEAAGDPAALAANLVEHAGLARAGLVLEMALVVSQVLAALWFHRLLRRLDPGSAGAVAVFGAFNAVAILASATFLWTALAVASDAALAPSGDTASTVHLLYRLSESSWGVGALFFGLWLIPMGRAVLGSRRWPAALGWVLVVGGVGYLVSAFVSAAFTGVPESVVLGLTLPATVGEFWMIGYLLTRGIRPRTSAPAVADDDGAPATAGQSVAGAVATGGRA